MVCPNNLDDGRRIFNQGLPEQFSFVTTFRNRRPGNNRWNLISITDTSGQPQFAVSLNPPRQTIEMSILNYNRELQTLSWEKPEVIVTNTLLQIFNLLIIF